MAGGIETRVGINNNGALTSSEAATRQAEIADPMRKMAFRFAALLAFVHLGQVQFLTSYVAHHNLYLLYLFGVPAMIGVVANGGLRRTLCSPPALYWLGFVAWLLVAVPFSSWKGGSARVVITYLRTAAPILLALGGLGVTWSECKSALRAIAWAAVSSVLIAPLFSTKVEGGVRSGLEFGTLGDPNDYAAHLVMLLPFILWVVVSAKSNLVRLVSLGLLVGAVIDIARTGSRGGFLALAVAIVYLAIRGTSRQRIGLAVLMPLAGILILAVAPHRAMDRMVSVVGQGLSEDEADASINGRYYLLKKSIEYTIEFPIFGVGAGEFADWESAHNKIIGSHGLAHNTHNTYTQVSSENGIPALILFLAVLISSYLLLRRVHREASARPDCADIRDAALVCMLSLVGFCTAITFLNFAYSQHIPVIAGLAILVSRCAENEFRDRSAAAPPEPAAAPAWAIPAPGVRLRQGRA